MKILILDDDIEIANNLKKDIKIIFPNYTIECYNKVNDLLLNMNPVTPTILFLDIFLPNNSGIELSNDIFNQNKNIPIVLYSGQPRESFDVYEGHHVYFLEKPFELAKIKKAIEIATSYFNNSFFTYEFARKKYAVPISNIIYFESNARQIRIFTTTETLTFYGVLDRIEEILNKTFIRVSKSFFVNPQFFEQVNDNFVILKKTSNNEAQTKINISRKYKQSVKENVLFAIHY